jgi:hypothetical protein
MGGFPGLLIFKLLHWGTFNPVTWAATCFLAIFINAVLEGMVVRFVFKTTVGKKGFGGLAMANALSVGIAYVSILVSPPSL